MQRSSVMVLSALVFFMMLLGPSAIPSCKGEENAAQDVKALRLSVGLFMEEDAAFLNKHLRKDDIVFTYKSKVRFLKHVKGPKTAFGAQSVQDIETALATLGDMPIDYISYNPERFRGSHASREERAHLIESVKRMKAIAEERNAKLMFGTDIATLEEQGERAAPHVDIFGIQLQRYQRESLDHLRSEAEKKIAIIRRGNKDVPIFLQLSLTPPEWKTITNRRGETKRVHKRGADGKKSLAPIKAEEFLRQMKAIEDLADGIVVNYGREGRAEMKRLIPMLRD